ncbi:MAG: hypothetical protein IPI39_12900 [Candidatus Obscuribacter sp.]|jgi:hypothetical protein|nr:hypothetical protein [Candidatus Obscuribacter sp.]MBK7838295.1 hypothetical protein [Candidatus Obscuribacter sp.]MBK9621853.1 hypothetical protein [Candidatus Obscuribacter sp.]
MNIHYHPIVSNNTSKPKLAVTWDWHSVNWIGVSMWCLPLMLFYVSAEIYCNSWNKTELDFAIANIWQYLIISVLILGLMHSAQSRKLTAIPLAFYSFCGAVVSLSNSMQHNEPAGLLVLATLLIGATAGFIYNDKSREMTSWAVTAVAVYFIACNVYTHFCQLGLHRLVAFQ